MNQRITTIKKLFAAWSSGNVDAPGRFLGPDATLWDNANGEFKGWEQIRAFFAKGVDRYPDLSLVPSGDYWLGTDSIALTWTMSATPEGRPPASSSDEKWHVPGMSIIHFDGLKVVREEDYHDKASQQQAIADA